MCVSTAGSALSPAGHTYYQINYDGGAYSIIEAGPVNGYLEQTYYNEDPSNPDCITLAAGASASPLADDLINNANLYNFNTSSDPLTYYLVNQNSNSYVYGLGEGEFSDTQLNSNFTTLEDLSGLAIVGGGPSDASAIFDDTSGIEGCTGGTGD